MTEANRTEETVPTIDFGALHAQQGEYCKVKGWPWFAPRVCWGCKREIYSHPRAQADAATRHITGCYHCHKSYCD
jgi:hypothetical protein